MTTRQPFVATPEFEKQCAQVAFDLLGDLRNNTDLDLISLLFIAGELIALYARTRGADACECSQFAHSRAHEVIAHWDRIAGQPPQH